ncbi:hypothetical protein QUA54_21645 [Microcoleus sp. MOSTC5]|uniref:hypothetical protein n=1 Tax=Microcoleus sp. MOSTC5 TaxID=3055378 RepID=UPI002FCF5D99
MLKVIVKGKQQPISIFYQFLAFLLEAPHHTCTAVSAGMDRRIDVGWRVNQSCHGILYRRL